MIGGVAILQIAARPLTGVERTLKRGFDIVISMLALIFLSPSMLIAAALVSMGSPGPVIYRQIRHGYDNRPIRALKFRTMFVTGNDDFRQATQNDCRITRIGRLFRMTVSMNYHSPATYLRRNVRGRTASARDRAHRCSARVLTSIRRHTIKRGLTGLAQVSGLRGETDTFDKMRNRIDCDLY